MMINIQKLIEEANESGMVICVPKGNSNKTSNGFWADKTRLLEF